MNHFVLFLSLTITFIGFSQTKQFKFEEGMCEYVGEYNSERYSEIEIQNTFSYIFFSTYINAEATAWKLEGISKLNLDTLKSECNYRLNQLKTIDIVNSEFWETARKNRIKEITETCNLKAITIIAYQKPDTLLSYSETDSLTNYFRNALIKGGKPLLDAWKALNKIQKTNNGMPKKIQQEFDEQYKSNKKMEYARLAVMQFGWWNHANNLLYHDPNSAEYWKEFEKLFTKLNSECY